MINRRLNFAAKSFGGVALAVAVVLSLSSCGGGGGSGGGGGAGVNVLGPEASAQIGRAAGSQPRPGSVTQGSRRDSGGVTADTVQRTGNGLRMTGRGDLAPVSTDLPGLAGARVFANQRAIAVAVTGFSTGNNPAPRYVETDPLLFGFWAYDAGGGTVEWGTFADGLTVAKTPAASIPATGSATYEGKALGAYENNIPGEEADSGIVTADVRLTALFTAGTVSGRLSNFRDNLPENTGLTGLEVMLKTADIDRNTPGGFFKGEVSGPQETDITGQWGGQFFGEDAGHIGGTFGASSGDGAYTAAGSFGAEKQ